MGNDHRLVVAIVRQYEKEKNMPNQDGAGPKGKRPKDGHGKGKGSGNCNGSCKDTSSGQGAMTGGKKGDKDKNKK